MIHWENFVTGLSGAVAISMIISFADNLRFGEKRSSPVFVGVLAVAATSFLVGLSIL